ncbi:uncharacterized protein [Tenebrio molitor]|jgi:hypothetical protein|uniref:uncharacterized protein n=1 Tax=Tenebrio molitor TaxID=7067 RepID=UPI003624995C
MNNTLLWYSSLFKHITNWGFRTALAQFVVFLFIFLGVSYLSTLIDITLDGDSTAEFISRYEKYVVLASSLYMIVPFAFSNLFLFGLFHKNVRILKAFAIGSLTSCAVILIVVIGSGIFLALKGDAYIAYSLIVVGVVLEVFLVHGILIALGARHKYLHRSEGSVNSETEET